MDGEDITMIPRNTNLTEDQKLKIEKWLCECIGYLHGGKFPETKTETIEAFNEVFE